MRAQLRSPTVLYALGYVIAALVIADQWLSLGSADTTRITVTVAIVALLVLVALTQWSAAIARRRLADDAAAAAVEQARVAAEVHASITESIHTIVVEVVAAQQAVVRGAYGDDILTRLTGADDNAHDALASLDRLLTGSAAPIEEAGTQQPVAA
jgi:Tfp pilus assembly protein FimT